MRFGVFFGLLMAPMLISPQWCSAATWPASCGNQTTKFEVKTEKSRGALAPSAEGQAQIVLLESQNAPFEPIGFPGRLATVRFGVDGERVGANRSVSTLWR